MKLRGATSRGRVNTRPVIRNAAKPVDVGILRGEHYLVTAGIAGLCEHGNFPRERKVTCGCAYHLVV